MTPDYYDTLGMAKDSPSFGETLKRLARRDPKLIREDGTFKGPGFLRLKTPSGDTMTELSASRDGMFFPLIVPTLTPEEQNHLASGGKPTEEIFQKAMAHARMRQEQGLSPFKEGLYEPDIYGPIAP